MLRFGKEVHRFGATLTSPSRPAGSPDFPYTPEVGKRQNGSCLPFSRQGQSRFVPSRLLNKQLELASLGESAMIFSIHHLALSFCLSMVFSERGYQVFPDHLCSLEAK